MTIPEKNIINVVKNLCIKSNTNLRNDVKAALKKVYLLEKNKKAKYVLSILIENYKIAERERLPICQDTGITCVFVEIGQNVRIKGNLTNAINKGVALCYKEGYLRKSIVNDPVLRKNTGTNTPAMIYYDIVRGNRLKISVMPKGFGSENKSKIFMLNPTATRKEIIEIVILAIRDAGSDACPPYIVGIGIGGDAAKASYLAKKSLLKPIGFLADKFHLKSISKEIFTRGNELDIGPAGTGGKTTLLGVNILSHPTHIAGLPVAVNISCHALRSASATI